MNFEAVSSPMKGSIVAEIVDTSGIPSNRIIRTTDTWQVNVQWTLSGAGAAFVSPNETWVVRVFIESIGPGFEGLVPPAAEIQATGGMNQSYSHTFSFPPNANMAAPNFSGVYKVVVVLTLKDPMGNPLPIAGFSEEPIIQFYRPN
ncbi:MAG: hypothetical protein SF123_10110 [Chloroflexota bacterium]|nr:hypothetical protein [Chloroflexota bacterium]